MESAAAKISPNGSAADALLDLPGYGSRSRSEWLDIDWRTHLHSVAINGRRVNYVQMGDVAAPTVVLIHGLAGCWQNWLENIPVLARDFNVLALDLPGFGASELPTTNISIDLYANTVIGLLDSLGIARASLIGNSMGGQTTAQTAIAYPQRIERIILVSPAGISTSRTPEALLKGAPLLGFALPRLAKGRKFYSRRPGLRKIALDIVAAHPERLRPELTYELMGGDAKLGFAEAARAVIDHDLTGTLSGVSCPTLIIWGRNDRIITSRDAARFADEIPDSRKIEISDTGYVAMLEHPEWFNRTAFEFLLGR